MYQVSSLGDLEAWLGKMLNLNTTDDIVDNADKYRESSNNVSLSYGEACGMCKFIILI